MRKQTKLWQCKDGKKIRICDMGDNHLINCIRLIERNFDKWKHIQINAMYSVSSMIRGDIASMSIENDILGLEESEVIDFLPIIENLYMEAERRNIKVEE